MLGIHGCTILNFLITKGPFVFSSSHEGRSKNGLTVVGEILG